LSKIQEKRSLAQRAKKFKKALTKKKTREIKKSLKKVFEI